MVFCTNMNWNRNIKKICWPERVCAEHGHNLFCLAKLSHEKKYMYEEETVFRSNVVSKLYFLLCLNPRGFTYRMLPSAMYNSNSLKAEKVWPYSCRYPSLLEELTFELDLVVPEVVSGSLEYNEMKGLKDKAIKIRILISKSLNQWTILFIQQFSHFYYYYWEYENSS